MKVVILTSHIRGIASRVLPALHECKDITITRVILAAGVPSNKKRHLKRKVKKTLKIGFLGAFNGIRLRKWYYDENAENIHSLCSSLDIQLCGIPSINSDAMRQNLRASGADLGISLGNGYIPKSVFSIPKNGMINIHMEILPEFRGAKSVIWPLYEGKSETGFTIHQIDNRIDTGEILYQERYPIKFSTTLQETIKNNLMTARARIPAAFCHVCKNYEALKAKAVVQSNGKSYTTPSIRQFFRIIKNHRRLYKQRREVHPQ